MSTATIRSQPGVIFDWLMAGPSENLSPHLPL
jgi:hypothetical protein